MPAGFLLWCLCFIIADILAYILDILSKRVREIHHALPLSVSNTLNSEYRTTTPLYLLSIWVFFWCQNTVVCEDDQVIINFVSFICRTICLVLSRYSIQLQNWASPVTITFSAYSWKATHFLIFFTVQQNNSEISISHYEKGITFVYYEHWTSPTSQVAGVVGNMSM